MSDVEIKVQSEFIQKVEGEPGCLFVIGLTKNISQSYTKHIHHNTESVLRNHFSGCDLLMLPPEVSSIQIIKESDLNKAGYYKKDDDTKKSD